MIDYIPPDIPPAVIEYVQQQPLPNFAIGRTYKYLTVWKGNLEIYITSLNHKLPPGFDKTKDSILTGLPNVIIYDCLNARSPSLDEVRDIHSFMAKYMVQNLQSEHVCHKDLEPFNHYITPNPYRKKPKYITPKYVPKSVVEYANKKYPVSWYPETYNRYIKYLTLYNDKYEVYAMYWTNSKTGQNSFTKYMLYDCKNVREYKNTKEYLDMQTIHPNRKEATGKPTYCSSKN